MKRSFLLLEFMIALVLLGVITAFLFSSYRDLSLTTATLQKEREEILQRQKLQLRLSQVLSHLTKIETKDRSYLFRYDNQTDPDPLFCGILEGSLYIDTKKHLILVSTSKKGGSRQEVLCEAAHSFELQFFNRAEGEWDQKYPDEKPFMAKIILNKSTILPFFL